MIEGRINGGCPRKGGKRRSSARNFTAMTNGLRMLRRCLIGCHLRRVGRRKAKSGSDPRGGKREGREGRGRMMMRAKLIILGGCKRLRTFSLLLFLFFSFFFLPFLSSPLFSPSLPFVRVPALRSLEFWRREREFDSRLGYHIVKRKNPCRRGTGPAKRWHNDEVNLMFPEFLWSSRDTGIRFFRLQASFVGFD